MFLKRIKIVKVILKEVPGELTPQQNKALNDLIEQYKELVTSGEYFYLSHSKKLILDEVVQRANGFFKDYHYQNTCGYARGYLCGYARDYINWLDNDISELYRTDEDCVTRWKSQNYDEYLEKINNE